MNVADIEYSLHVGCDDRFIQAASDLCRKLGGTLFELDLETIASNESLVDQFIDVFQIPYPMTGVDATISLGSDLDWIDNRELFVVVVRSLDRVQGPLLETLSVIFTRIIDRMRGAGDRYTVIFPASPRTAELVTMIAAENRHLAELERIDPQSDTHPVPIIDHRDDPPSA